ncbi:MAG: hypothetical protein WBD27_00935 [Pyrinomonadaceae bacterium]
MKEKIRIAGSRAKDWPKKKSARQIGSFRQIPNKNINKTEGKFQEFFLRKNISHQCRRKESRTSAGRIVLGDEVVCTALVMYI